MCGKSCLCQSLSGEWLWLDAHTYIHITHLYLTRSAYQSTRLYQLPYTDHARGLVGGCFSSRRKDHWCATLILLELFQFQFSRGYKIWWPNLSKRAKKRSRQSKEQRLWVWTQEKLTLSLYYYSPNLKYFTTVPVPPLAHYSFLEQEPARRLPNECKCEIVLYGVIFISVQPMWVNLQWLLLHSQPDLPLCLYVLL